MATLRVVEQINLETFFAEHEIEFRPETIKYLENIANDKDLDFSKDTLVSIAFAFDAGFNAGIKATQPVAINKY